MKTGGSCCCDDDCMTLDIIIDDIDSNKAIRISFLQGHSRQIASRRGLEASGSALC